MTKWYLIAVVVVVTVGVGAIAFLDSTQPKEVNVELANKIIGIITAVLPVLLLQLNNSSKIDGVKQDIKEAPAQVVQAAEKAKAVVTEAATQAADKLTKTADAAANKLQGG